MPNTVKCMKCGGDGYIPKYSWNVGGVCFLCGGDGKVKMFDSDSFLDMDEVDSENFVSHSSTKGIIGALRNKELNSMAGYQKEIVVRELIDRGKKLGASTEPPADNLIRSIEDTLEETENSMPRPWEDDSYAKSGKVSEVPVHWLKKFQGNELRRSDEEMKDFAEKIKEEGLREPVIITIGQQDRKVSVAEGNHRMNAFIEAGLENIPARVMRQNTNPDGVPYDRMSKVPEEGYFKGDASPEEVFDTYYDGDEKPRKKKNKEKSAKDKAKENNDKILNDTLKGYNPVEDLSSEQVTTMFLLFNALRSTYGFKSFGEMIPKLKELGVLSEIRGKHKIDFGKAEKLANTMSG